MQSEKEILVRNIWRPSRDTCHGPGHGLRLWRRLSNWFCAVSALRNSKSGITRGWSKTDGMTRVRAVRWWDNSPPRHSVMLCQTKGSVLRWWVVARFNRQIHISPLYFNSRLFQPLDQVIYKCIKLYMTLRYFLVCPLTLHESFVFVEHLCSIISTACQSNGSIV